MSTPTVTENPRRLEPVDEDPFIDGLGAAGSDDVPPPYAPGRAGRRHRAPGVGPSSHPLS